MAERVAGQDLGGLLHLLLIHDQAVGRLEHLAQRLFELGVDRRDLLLPVLAQRVVRVGVHAHRARPVQGTDGGDVLEVVRLHRSQQRAHRSAVELEHAERVTAGQQLVGGLVVQRQAQQVDRDVPVLLDRRDRVGHDRQVAQAEEVHLQQPEALAGRVVELRDDRAVGGPGPDRDVIGQRLRGHDHPGRVHAGLADQPLDPAGGVDDLLDLRFGLVQRAELASLLVPGVSTRRRFRTAGCPCPSRPAGTPW